MNITKESYVAMVRRINKLEAAIDELAHADDPALRESITAMKHALAHTCELLARSLAIFAHDATAALVAKGFDKGNYYIADIFEALGRFAYSGRASESHGSALLGLGYDIEKIETVLAGPGPEPVPEPATISEYEREMEPTSDTDPIDTDPGLIRA